MPSQPSNVDRLVEADVVKAQELSAEEIEIINNDFTEAEILHLISARQKLGEYPRHRKFCAWWV